MSKAQLHPLLGIFVLIVFVLIFAVASIVLFLISDNVNTGLQAENDIAQIGKDSYSDFNSQYPSTLDGGFLFLFVGLWFGLLVGAYFARDHPLILVVLFFLMAILIYAGAMMSNFYQELASDPDLINYSTQLPNIAFIMSHLVEFIVGIFATVGLALMFKQQQTI